MDLLDAVLNNLVAASRRRGVAASRHRGVGTENAIRRGHNYAGENLFAMGSLRWRREGRAVRDFHATIGGRE
jgi:hypothetical protein